MSLIVRAVVVFVLLALPVKAAAQSPPSFGQLSGKDGCIVATSETYYEDCGRAAALDTPLALILSPDDKQLYVVGTKGLVTFNRAADTGGGGLCEDRRGGKCGKQTKRELGQADAIRMGHYDGLETWFTRGKPGATPVAPVQERFWFRPLGRRAGARRLTSV